MKHPFESIILIATGLIVLLNRNSFAKSAVEFQSKTFRRNYGEKELKMNIFVAVLTGSLFIVFGLAIAMGLIGMR
jgi:uncharacterized membrane protein